MYCFLIAVANADALKDAIEAKLATPEWRGLKIEKWIRTADGHHVDVKWNNVDAALECRKKRGDYGVADVYKVRVCAHVFC